MPAMSAEHLHGVRCCTVRCSIVGGVMAWGAGAIFLLLLLPCRTLASDHEQAQKRRAEQGHSAQVHQSKANGMVTGVEVELDGGTVQFTVRR